MKKSFIGNYFVLYGEDVSFFVDNSGKSRKVHHKSNAFTFSPVNDYKRLFLKVEELVRKEFPGIRLISGRLIQSAVISKNDNSVYSILFDDAFTERFSRIGDLKYGFSDWEI